MHFLGQDKVIATLNRVLPPGSAFYPALELCEFDVLDRQIRLTTAQSDPHY